MAASAEGDLRITLKTGVLAWLADLVDRGGGGGTCISAGVLMQAKVPT